MPVTFDLIRSRVHPEDLSLTYDIIEGAERAVDEFEYEQRVLMPDGSTKHLHWVARAHRDHQGRLEYIGWVQDILKCEPTLTAKKWVCSSDDIPIPITGQCMATVCT